MSDYIRSTRACPFHALRPELLAAIREKAATEEWGDLESDIVMCCETTSKKKKKGLLDPLKLIDPDPVHYIGMLFTPKMLIWARSGAKFGVAVNWARLSDIEVRDFASPLPKFSDTGFEVFGLINRMPGRGTVFVGMGEEGDALRFRDALKEAVSKARE